ncbi:DUF2493 domain-containing protein [Geoalkalibacter halelectricus]|uniref:DUF2493 domain-containing protein n=1 Tax=Geoalkalibacter halelectricus TaxID=2847045 RepID=UPI003D24E9AC
MRVIIAGSRSCCEPQHLEKAIAASGFAITAIVSGGARGVDRLGEAWANRMGVPIHRFAPNWQRYGRGAGPQRNREMADAADGLIALWDGKSKGTAHMIDTARKKGLKVFVVRIDK